AAEFEAKGAEGVAYAKRLTRAALERPVAEGLADERASFLAVMQTASAREGMRAGRAPASIQALLRALRPPSAGNAASRPASAGAWASTSAGPSRAGRPSCPWARGR